MSAEIIQFVARPLRKLKSGSHAIPFRPAVRPDDLIDHADTAPCEYVFPCEDIRPERT
jgi:hypothetical protein